MGTNYKPFKHLGQMINQPSGKHWMERNKLTEKHGFNSSKFYGKKSHAKHKALDKAKGKGWSEAEVGRVTGRISAERDRLHKEAYGKDYPNK